MLELEDTIALIVDECSMMSALLLGTMEVYCKQAAFKGAKSHLSWGGLPIVVLVGDDYQLPSIDEGAIYCQEKRVNRLRTSVEEVFVQNGMDLSLEFGKDVMILPQTRRVLEGQTHLQHILNGVRDC